MSAPTREGNKNSKKVPSVPVRILRAVILVPAALVVFILTGLLILTALEYRPAPLEELTVSRHGDGGRVPGIGERITLATWNVGYGALGDNADFFLDGGSMVQTADREGVSSNLTAICDTLSEIAPDIVLLQELDRDGTRSCHTDERQFLLDHSSVPAVVNGCDIYACNFHAVYVPYPIPPIGSVDSGILTISSLAVEHAERVALPCPFSWPVRIANLKRCLLVTSIPVAGSDRELVLVNLHLEAFDNGEGKVAQTRQLAELLEREAASGNYVIAGGDFNQTFSSVDASAYPKLPDKWHCGEIDTASFAESYQFWMDNSTPSCRSLDRPLADAPDRSPSAFQYYLVDGFIVSENIAVESIRTLDLGFSCTDHNPVVMTVRIGEE